MEAEDILTAPWTRLLILCYTNVIINTTAPLFDSLTCSLRSDLQSHPSHQEDI